MDPLYARLSALYYILGVLLLSGIVIGEIGPKLGMNTNDNGYLGFEKFRIPRDQLLMKHSQVLEDGPYVKPTNSKLSYATMVFVRVVVCQVQEFINELLNFQNNY